MTPWIPREEPIWCKVQNWSTLRKSVNFTIVSAMTIIIFTAWVEPGQPCENTKQMTTQSFHAIYLLATDDTRYGGFLHTVESGNVDQLCGSSHWLHFLHSIRQKVRPKTYLHHFRGTDVSNNFLDGEDGQLDRAVYHQSPTRTGRCDQWVYCRDNCELRALHQTPRPCPNRGTDCRPLLRTPPGHDEWAIHELCDDWSRSYFSV